MALLFCCSAGVDFVLKPLFIYRQMNLRFLKGKMKIAFQSFGLQTGRLRLNAKYLWLVQELLRSWSWDYVAQNNLAFKVLLILYNTPGRPGTVQRSNPNIDVIFVPPNTTSVIQPLDRGVVDVVEIMSLSMWVNAAAAESVFQDFSILETKLREQR